MPARTRKPVTTAAEATALADVDQAAVAAEDAAIERARSAPARGEAKKPGRKKAGLNGAAVQALLTASEAGAVGATFLPALPVGQIRPSADNPRDTLPDLDELRDSIAEHGVLEPLVVAEADPQDGDDGVIYDLVFGHRRLAAATAAGLTAVPAVVRNDLVGRPADIARLVENLQRVDLNPIEEARGISRLVEAGMQQKDVAVAISRNQGHVSKRLRLLHIPPSAQALVARGELPVDVAVDLSRLPADEQVKIMAGSTAVSAIASRVAHRAAELKAADELAKVAAQLRKAGLTVLVETSYPRRSIVEGPFPLEDLRRYGDDYKVPARHDKLACHAALVAPSYYLGHRTADELADDPLSAHYQLVCTAPASHLTAAAKAADAEADVDAAEVDRLAAQKRAAAEAQAELLGSRWAAAVRLVQATPRAKTGGEARRDHTARVLLFDALTRYEVDPDVWAATGALLAGDPEPASLSYNSGPGDAPGVRTILAAALAGGPGLERATYATALATGHVALRYGLRVGAERTPCSTASLAALHLAHLGAVADVLVTDPVEGELLAAGADLEAALIDVDLLAKPEPEDELAPPAGRPVEDVHLPADEPDPAAIAEGQQAIRDALAGDAEPDETPAAVAEPDLRRSELGVTREAEADYGVRIGGGQAYLVPGIKTAKGLCATCHAQVPIRSGGLAGKHTRDVGPCPGAGEPVMTLDQALPARDTGTPADQLDPDACPTCEGVGRIGTRDDLCSTCAGKGLVAPQLV